VLGAVDGDPQRDHAGVLAEVHAVDHQAHQVQLGQVGTEELGQRGRPLLTGELPRGHLQAFVDQLARHAFATSWPVEGWCRMEVADRDHL
jgi:hypothetical protein